VSLCLHLDLTPVDADGYGLCTACGARVVCVLTPTVLHASIDAIKRDHGRYGRHSRACVDSDLGWVCAPDCGLVRR
jgi:hypothetical protein